MNKRGFTLMEFLVYMAIVGVVVIIAGNAFSDSTRIRLGSESMLKANKEAETMGNLFRDDVAQMGAKTVVNNAHKGGLRAAGLEIASKVYMDSAGKDFSSFTYYPGKKKPAEGERNQNQDCLVMRKVQLNDDESFRSVEEITWFTTYDGILKRACRTIFPAGVGDSTTCPEMPPQTECPDKVKDLKGVVELSSGVSKFVITPATPDLLGGEDPIFPYSSDDGRFRLISRSAPHAKVIKATILPPTAATSFGITDFVTNYVQEGETNSNEKKQHQVFVGRSGETGDEWLDCYRFSFQKDKTYEIAFKTPYAADYSRMFRQKYDHMSIGLRTVKDGELMPCGAAEDMLIFPPQSKDAPDGHIFRFTPRADYANVCIMFTMSFYSPRPAHGTLNIADINVKQVSDRNYKFVPGYKPEIEDKANVRAFKLDLQVKRNGVAGASVMVVPVPSNGTLE